MNTRIATLIVIICCLSQGLLKAQEELCSLSNDCGDLFANIEAGGSLIFCEGQTVTLQNTSDPGFDYFLVDWGDESPIETINDYADLEHIYDDIFDDPCTGSNMSFFIRLRGVVECDAGTTCSGPTYEVGIRPPVQANAAVELQQCVNTEYNFTNTSCNANTYLWTFGDGTISTDESPSHTYTSTNDYTVTLEATGFCGTDIYTFNVEVVDQPNAVFDASDDDGIACLNSIITFTNQSNSFTNISWELQPGMGDTNVWCFTDTLMNASSEVIEVLFKQLGTYTLTLNGSNACGEEETELEIEIVAAPVINIEEPDAACDMAAITPDDLDFDVTGAANTICWDFVNANNQPTQVCNNDWTANFTQSGSISVTVNGSCGNITEEVDVIVQSSEAITLDLEAEYCTGDPVDTLTASQLGGNWSGPGVTNGNPPIFDPADAGSGTHEISYAITNGACDNSATATVTVTESAAVSVDEPDAACDEIVLTPALLNYDLEGVSNSVCWTFVNADISGPICDENWTATFNQSGSITVTAQSDCGDIVRTIDVTVQSSAEPVLTVEDDYCTGSSPDTLGTDQPGGDWSGPGIIDEDLGIFDPAVAGAGTHQITYEITEGACDNLATVEVVVLQSAELTLGTLDLCIGDAPVAITADPPGGEWSGTGIIDASAGTFDPVMSGFFQPTYDYLDVNTQCAVSGQAAVQVDALPVATVVDTTLVCLVSESLSLTDLSLFAVDSTGGNLSWTLDGNALGDETFNPVTDLGGVGDYIAQFDYAYAPCAISGQLVVRVIENPMLTVSPDTTICISENTLFLQSNLTGGMWSGPGIVDPLTGEIDLNAAGGGDHQYTYTFQPGGSCEQNGGMTVTVEDPGSLVNAGNEQTVCEGTTNTITLTGGMPAGGIWTGPGIIDGMAGTVDLSMLVPGTDYEYSYTITGSSSESCTASANKQLRYFVRPTTTYTVDGSLCINETFILNPVGNVAGNTYCWDFGDGSPVVCTPNPTHMYTSGGNFTISLTVTSAAPENCSADTTAMVYVTTPPNPDFTLDSLEGCAPFTVSINDLSTGDEFTTQWCIGQDVFDGPPPTDYLIDGFVVDTFITVSLKTTNFCGLRTKVDSVLVRPYPAVNFDLDVDDGCSPFSPEISNITLGNPDAFFWDMGNGVFGNDLEAPAVSYTTPEDSVSIYFIRLVAENECGRDTLDRMLTVHPPDVEAFISVDTIAGCQPWTFEPTSFSTPGAFLFWEVFGPDGSVVASGDSVSPSFVLYDVGLHTVVLSAARCGADMDTIVVEVLPAPEVSFGNLPQVCFGNEVSFNNTSPSLSGAVWDFGDGGSSTELNPVYAYDSAGTFTINMTGFSPLNGCPNTATGEITVTPLPVVDFVPQDTAGCSPLVVTFENATSGTPDLTYSWNFGDGSNNDTAPEPTHAFEATGNYVVSLTATDGFGCANSTTFSSIRVFPDPVANFMIEDEQLCTRYDSLRLTDASEGATAIFWTVGSMTSEVAMPVFAVNSPGTAPIQLVVRNDSLCYDTLIQNYTVIESPTALIDATPADLCLNEAVSFTSNSTATDLLLWELGDETGSNEAQFEHIYPAAGTYPVSLVASANNECPADTAYTEIVVRPLPIAAFTPDVPTVCGAPAMIGLSNESSGAVGYEWVISDGQNFTQFEPALTIAEPGFYDIALTAETEFGCLATTSQTITVRGNPVAGFEPPAPLACAPYTLSLLADTTQALRYEWYLNDAILPSTGQQLDTLLTETSSYDLRLIAIFDDQCRDTLDFPELLDLEARPIADFNYVADDSMNVLGDVRFENLSQFGTDYYWDLGDGTISRAFEPYHEYEINRDIEVLLAVTTNYGAGLVCTDTIVKPIAPEWLTEFFVPTAFAPESIGAEFGLFGAKGVGVASYSLSVYSPFGQLVYTTSELEEGRPTGRWDGRLPNGDLILQGAYTWRAKVTFVNENTRNLVGTVTVIR